MKNRLLSQEIGEEMALVENLSTLSMIMIAVFFVLVVRVYLLYRELNKTMKESVQKIGEKMEQLEHEYIKLKPKLDEINATLDEKVDYDFLEKKMHELVSLVLNRQQQRETPNVQRKY
jgi:uncharacterized protein YoxC